MPPTKGKMIDYKGDQPVEFDDIRLAPEDMDIVTMCIELSELTGDILLLAGDIGYLGDDNYSKHPFWDWASENYKEVASPLMPPISDAYRYCRHHPAMTA